MTEVLRYTQLGKEDIRFGTGTFQVVLADGRKVTLTEVDVGAILAEQSLSTQLVTLLSASATETIIQEAIDDAPVGGAVLLSPGATYEIQSLVINKAITFGSLAGIHRTYETNASVTSGVILQQTSGTKAIHLQAPAGTILNGIHLMGFEVKPSADGGGTDGIYLDAPTGTSLFGVVLERVAVRRFGGVGVNCVGTGTGGIFDVTFRDCNLENWTTSSGPVVDCTNADPGALANQIKFYNCFVSSRLAGEYALKGAPFELYGTIVQDATGGAHGVDLVGGGIIFGGNIEGAATVGTRGVRYTGSNGAFICPGALHNWGTGVAIGDGTASVADGAVIWAGTISNNVTQDVLLTAAGSRQRTTVMNASSSFVVTNDRFTVNGSYELHTIPTLPVIATASIPAGSSIMDGRQIIENNGAGDRNLIFYGGGERFRIDGGAAF